MKDIENFGSPNNVDAAPNENNLIDFAKRPGRRAHQKKELLFPKSAKDWGIWSYKKSLSCIVNKFGQQELPFWGMRRYEYDGCWYN